MKELSEEIRKQLHEFRNILGHLQFKVTDLEEQISELRISLEERMDRAETKVTANSFKIGEQQREISKCLGKHKDSPQKSGG